jgi:hypothetical protein
MMASHAAKRYLASIERKKTRFSQVFQMPNSKFGESESSGSLGQILIKLGQPFG